MIFVYRTPNSIFAKVRIRRQETGVRSQELGVRSQESEFAEIV
ncbi:MAG: hypothetical protein AB4080_13060 [Trichodesmium sp.]